MVRRVLLVCFGWMSLIGVLLPAPTQAHPLDLLLHDMRVQLQPTQATLTARLVVGALVTARLWDEIDADGSEALDDAEIEGWCNAYLAQLETRFDQTALAWSLGTIQHFPRTRASFMAASSTELEWTATAPMPPTHAGAHELSLRGSAYSTISVYDWSKTRGQQGIVVREASARDSLLMRFPVSWPATLNPANAQPAPAALPERITQSDSTRSLISHLEGRTLTPLFVLAALGMALVFGALHALQPGHGKTMVAAYLVGSRGTVRQAIVLGGIVTLTHTSSVLLLGSLLLTFSAWMKPERIIPGLTLISGSLIVGLGVKLAWERLHQARHGLHSHSHDSYNHQHHDHQHAPADLTSRALVSLGISGGLVPCTEALVILIVAATIGRLALGLAMIVAFSLGLAAVLIAIGIAMVTAGERLLGRVGREHRAVRWLPVVSAVLVVTLGAALILEGWSRV